MAGQMPIMRNMEQLCGGDRHQTEANKTEWRQESGKSRVSSQRRWRKWNLPAKSGSLRQTRTQPRPRRWDVPGSLILIGGEPGIGKSTLMLQIGLALKNQKVLYVSGEESEQQ